MCYRYATFLQIFLLASILFGFGLQSFAQLYSQLNLAGSPYPVVSQEYLGASSYLAYAADDFEVPSGIVAWSITDIRIDGAYHPGTGSGTVQSVNLYFLHDVDTWPQYSNMTSVSPAFKRENYLHVAESPSGTLNIDLEQGQGPVELTPGRYWLCVQARLDSADGEWGWEEVAQPVTLSESVWMQSSTFWTTTCIGSWGRTYSTCGFPNTTQPTDLAFALYGVEVNPSVTVTPSPALSSLDEGNSAAFTVVLGSQPSGNVVIPVNVDSSHVGQIEIDQNQLTFTAANFHVPQNVNVTAVADHVDELPDSQTYTVNNGPCQSPDLNYNDLVVDSVSVTVNDMDTAGLVVTPTTVVTGEDGTTAIIQVSLNSQPAGSAVVDVPVVSLNTDEGEITPPASLPLEFENSNWNIPRDIEVTGQDDLDCLGNGIYEIRIGPTTSTSDPIYNGDPNPTIEEGVAATNIDDELINILDPTVFPDAEINTYLNAEFPDGLSECDARDIVEFNFTSVDGTPLTDLTGFEYFTGLESIDVSYNRIEDLGPLKDLPDLGRINGDEVDVEHNLVNDDQCAEIIPAILGTVHPDNEFHYVNQGEGWFLVSRWPYFDIRDLADSVSEDLFEYELTCP